MIGLSEVQGAAVHGVGIDLLAISRVERMLLRRGLRAYKLFTPAELGDAGQGPMKIARLAVRLAAKEAAYKALRLGGPLIWREIGVVKDSLGRPSIELIGKTAAGAQAAGVAKVHLSLSHERDMVAAFAVAMEA